VEILYSLVSGRWGEGFATEITRESADVAFGDLGLAEVVAYTLVYNKGSRNVMEKSGFQFERELTHADLPHVLYRLRRGGSEA
jgi:RimJ/RimL family protein N-acetyltransferase